MMKYCHLYSMFNVPYHSKPINSFVKGPPQNLHPLPSSFPLPYILFLCNCGSISLTFSLTSSYTNLVPSHMRSHNQYGSAIHVFWTCCLGLQRIEGVGGPIILRLSLSIPLFYIFLSCVTPFNCLVDPS